MVSTEVRLFFQFKMNCIPLKMNLDRTCLKDILSFIELIVVLPFKDRKATLVVLSLSSHNFPTNRARELYSRPSNEAESLLGLV